MPRKRSVVVLLGIVFLVVNAVLLAAAVGSPSDGTDAAVGDEPGVGVSDTPSPDVAVRGESGGGVSETPNEATETPVDWTTAGVPAGLTDCRVPASVVSVNFTRTPDAQMFTNNSHDAIVLDRPTGGYSLIAHDFGGWRNLYQTESETAPTELDRWEHIERRVNGEHTHSMSIDTMVRVNDTYYAYQGGRVFTSKTIASRNWTAGGPVPSDDHGVYYDTEEGVFHLYYEGGDRSEHSGEYIGHATSPNGVDNWTVYPPVYTPPEGFKAGDFDIVATGGLYVMFGDYTSDHPQYSVSVWVNDNLYTNFTRVGNAMTPSDRSFGTADYYGIQDADVIENGPTGEYVMFAHGHTGESGDRYIHWFEGEIEVPSDNATEQCDGTG